MLDTEILPLDVKSIKMRNSIKLGVKSINNIAGLGVGFKRYL